MLKMSVHDREDLTVLAPLLLGTLCGLVAAYAAIEATYCSIYAAEAGQCGRFSCPWDNLAAMDLLRARNLSAPDVMGARYAWIAFAGVVGSWLLGTIADKARRRLEGGE